MNIKTITIDNYKSILAFKPGVIRHFEHMNRQSCFLVDQGDGIYSLRKSLPKSPEPLEEAYECELCGEGTCFPGLEWDNNNKRLVCKECNTDYNATYQDDTY